METEAGLRLSQQSKSVLCGKEYGDLPSLEERTGYTAGWYTDEGTPVASSTMVQTAADHTIHAHWTAINQYNLTFEANGGKE